MPGSFRIGTVRGIPVKVHFTLAVVFAVFVVQMGLFGIPAGVVLFTSVLLHELGHALVGQRYGVRIAGIELHLLGGTAMMANPPKRPAHEVVIAAAGPAVSVLLGSAATGLSFLLGSGLTLGVSSWGDLLSFAATVNLGMAVFNLFPALPMDGGRILRALLALRLGPLPATRIAVGAARLFAVLFFLAGLFGGQFGLGLIGVLVWILAGQELRAALAQEAQRRSVAAEPRVGWAPATAPGGPGMVIDVGGPAGGGTERPKPHVVRFGRLVVVSPGE